MGKTSTSFVRSLLHLLILTAAASHVAEADIVRAEDYDFPLKNPLLSTVASVANNSTQPIDVVSMIYKNDRGDFVTLKGQNKIEVGLFAQNKPAPLMFVVAGVGGAGINGSGSLLAQTYASMGYHAVTLPNPVSWGYVVGVSDTTLPGYMPRDAREYYQFLRFVVTQLKEKKHLQVTSYAISGYSLGGLLTAFLLNEDNQQHVFNFTKAIMINPAYDMNFGIQQLDALDRQGDIFTEAKKININGRLQDVAIRLPQFTNPIEGIVKLAKDLNFTDPELSWVIGDSFRHSLTEIILVSQQIKDLGILKTPAMTETRRDVRTNEAAQFTFLDYMRIFVAPSVIATENSHASEHELMRRSSLFALTDMLKADTRAVVFENADDLIVNHENIEDLKATFGNRLYLYPYGGHVGNLWYERNLKDLAKVLMQP